MRFTIYILATLSLGLPHLHAEDWATYRHDNRRSGVSPETLTLPLREVWKHEGGFPRQAWSGPAKWDAYSSNDGLQSMRNFDPCHYVTVAQGILYYGSSRDNAVHALDLESGNEKWVFFTEAPVRFPPTLSDGRALAGSDDGHVYALQADSGKLIWKDLGAPVQRRIPSNESLISLWPVRAGVMVHDGVAYYAASLAPWEPSWLIGTDPATGRRKFTAEHQGITMQGALLAGEKNIFAPQGRLAPLLIDPATGAQKGSIGHAGGVFCLLTTDDQLIAGPNNQKASDSQLRLTNETGQQTATFNNTTRAVVVGNVAYLHSGGNLKAFDRVRNVKVAERTAILQGAEKAVKNAKKKIGKLKPAAAKNKERLEALEATLPALTQRLKEVRAASAGLDQERAACWLWSIPQPPPHEMVVAGDILFLGLDQKILAVSIKDGSTLWTQQLPGKVHGLAVSDGHLIASTHLGTIHAFAP